MRTNISDDAGLQHRVLGLDPGTVRMGYAIIEMGGPSLRCLDCGVFAAKAGWERDRRLGVLGADLEALIDDWGLGATTGADSVGYEEGFVQGQQGALSLGAARGIAVYLSRKAGMETTGYAPSTVKKAVTGHGHAEKEQVAEMVKKLLGLRTTPEPDAADACAVAICHTRSVTVSA